MGSLLARTGVQQTCLLQTEHVDFIDEENGEGGWPIFRQTHKYIDMYIYGHSYIQII